MTVSELKEMGKHLATGAGFVANFNYASEIDYFDKGIEYKPLLALWSLSLEEQYYIIWPVVLLFVSRLKFDYRKVTFVLLLIMFFVSCWVYGNHPSESYYLPQSRFWELLAGSFLATTMRDRHLGKGLTADLFSLLGFLLLIGGMLAALSATPANLIVPVLGSILLILSGPEAFLNRHLLSSSLMVGIGLISYCLYLWHWPLLSLTKVIFLIEPGTFHRLGLYGLTFILSWLSYKFVEKPCRRSQRKSIPLMLFGIVLFLGIFGSLLFKTNFIKPFQYSRNSEGKLALFDVIIRNDPDLRDRVFKERGSVIRNNLCHHHPTRKIEKYLSSFSQCFSGDFSRPTFVVLGDSYSADIYGALTLSRKDLTFVQLTGGRCNHRNAAISCRKIFDFATSFAIDQPVQGVIFSGNWDSNFPSILETIRKLRKHNKKVILIGRPPEYLVSPLDFLSKRNNEDDLNKLSRRFLDPKQLRLNKEMEEFARKNQIPFVNLVGFFCDDSARCELLSENGGPYVIDTAHLSVEGMEYVGRKLNSDETFSKFTHGASE